MVSLRFVAHFVQLVYFVAAQLGSLGEASQPVELYLLASVVGTS